MALWGTPSLVYSAGKVNVHFAEKEIRRHSGSIDFVAAGVSTGDVISVGAGRTVGQAVVSGVVGVHTVSIATTNFLTHTGTNTILNLDYYIDQQPKSAMADPNLTKFDNLGFDGGGGVASEVIGVDATEVGIGTSIGDAGQHAGWVGIMTYMGVEGEVRTKSETLVAMSGITSDRT